MYELPARNRASSTPWSSTRSRCTGSTPRARRYSATEASRSATAIPTWSMSRSPDPGAASAITGRRRLLALSPAAARHRRRLQSVDEVDRLGQVIRGRGEGRHHRGDPLIADVHRGPWRLEGVELDELHELLQRGDQSASL